MNRKLFLYFSLLSFLLYTACSDIIEADISKDKVCLVTPLNNIVTNVRVQNFRWRELQDADYYRLVVVSPRFDSILSYAIERDIHATRFDTSLSPGVYEWTILGVNEGYESDKTIRSLTILDDSTQNLSQQTVLLVNPTNGAILSDSLVNFLWQGLENATEYKLQVASPNFTNSSFIKINENLTADNFSTHLVPGNYKWRVRGENDISISNYGEGNFSINLSSLEAPNLVAPVNFATVNLPVTLSWGVDDNSVRDTLYVYTDINLSNEVLKVATVNTDFSFNDNSATEYFWRLRSVDASGTVSSYSETRRFSVQ